MTSSPTLLADLPAAVVTAIRAILPALARCETMTGRFDLAELNKSGIPAPAVRVSVLGLKESGRAAGDFVEFGARMAAYVITRDRLGRTRDEHAATIAQAICSLVPADDWGMDAIGPAEDVACDVLASVATRDAGVALWAVTWTQPLTFYARTTEVVPVELYVAEGAAGTGNAGDYAPVGGEA